MIANPTRAGGSGNTAFFEQLYSAHHRAILAYCARRCSRWDAWDAAAEVFVVAWRRAADVPPAEEARAWLIGVAYRVVANHHRGERRRAAFLQRARVSEWTSPADEHYYRAKRTARSSTR
jgi:DNA-directed RNA polymerase specialized sigma24 family protein